MISIIEVLMSILKVMIKLRDILRLLRDLGKLPRDFYLIMYCQHFKNKARQFIERKNANNEQPFFLYFSLTHLIHPWLPISELKIRQRPGKYGDFVNDGDETVSEVFKIPW